MSTNETTETVIESVSSPYRSTERLHSTRYKQGGRTIYGLALTPDEITTLVPRPAPDIPGSDNRQIRLSHANGFARYFIDNANWVVPGIILTSKNIFTFERREEEPGVEFGFVGYSKRDAGGIRILDGQHRILGFFIAYEQLTEQLDKARSKKSKARQIGLDARAIADIDAEIRQIQSALDRFTKERVSVEIQVTDSPTEARQAFFDIADNALGITQSVKARFDTRQAINRALPAVLEHPVLQNRVEMNLDRVQRNSPAWLSARQVTEIMRVLMVGFDGRISKRKNAELQEAEIERESLDFFDRLVEFYPPVADLLRNHVSAGQLRESMLLGNALFIRVLAGVQYELVHNHGWPKADAWAFLAKLAKHSLTRAHENSIWRLHAPDSAFNPNALGPNGRRADSTALVRTITDWAVMRAPFVDADPLPAPVEAVIEPDPDEGLDFAFDHDTKALDVEMRNEIEEIAKQSKARARRVKGRG